MDNKESIFKDLETLTRMCHGKNDGASLKIEEEEIKEKIEELDAEINEIKQNIEDELYDSSAEMADRNIQIVLKKLIQNLKATVKTIETELADLKDDEKSKHNQIEALEDRIESNTLYIESIKNRLSSVTDEATLNKYQNQLNVAEEEINKYASELSQLKEEYKLLQEKIEQTVSKLEKLNKRIETKQEQLEETEQNLNNKEAYIDYNKKSKNDKKIAELTSKKDKLTSKLEEISEDPKFLELKIKEILTRDSDIFEARPYLERLVEKANSVPYMNRPLDNELEQELLNATKQRDRFASEIDKKDYSVLSIENPEQLRINYLNQEIENWNKEISELEEKASIIDGDSTYNYQSNINRIAEIINNKKQELAKCEQQYASEPDSNISAKASLKLLIEENRADLKSAEEIISAFKTEEANAIIEANRLINEDCVEINNKIEAANEEIKNIKERLASKKSGMIDINEQNKDKEQLKELAKVVVDIKHRRQFTESPNEIAERLEKQFNGETSSIEVEENDSSRGIKVTDTEEVNEPIAPSTFINQDNDLTNNEISENPINDEENAPISLTEINEDNNSVEEEEEPIVTAQNITGGSELDKFLENLTNSVE